MLTNLREEWVDCNNAFRVQKSNINSNVFALERFNVFFTGSLYDLLSFIRWMHWFLRVLWLVVAYDPWKHTDKRQGKIYVFLLSFLLFVF